MPITEEKMVEKLLEEVVEENMFGYSPIRWTNFFTSEEEVTDKEIFFRTLAQFVYLTYHPSQMFSPLFEQDNPYISVFEKSVYEGILSEVSNSAKADTLLKLTSKDDFENALLRFVDLSSIEEFEDAYEDEIENYLEDVAEDFLEYKEQCLENFFDVAEDKLHSDYLADEDDDFF